MQKMTKIVGVQSKIGQNSKVKSNVTLEVTDKQIIDLQQYYLSVRAGENPEGKIKKVELHILYDEDMKSHGEDLEIDNIISSSTDLIDSIVKDKKCGCSEGAFVNGKCANCGGVE